MVFECAKRASAEFGDKVIFKEINTYDREVFLEWGIMDALYIDDKLLSNGPPLSYEKIRAKIARAVKRL